MLSIKKEQSVSAINATLAKKSSKKEEEETFNVSFRYLDTSQKFGSSFLDWEKCGWLSKALETLRGYCNLPLHKQFDGQKFARYESLPPKEQMHFTIPANITEDAKWARIHVLNKAVLVGHYVGNTFYVVFLDKTHKFWEKKKQ